MSKSSVNEYSWPNDMTLEEARKLMETLIYGGGVKCPCCTQLAKVYERVVNAAQAYDLIRMYTEAGVNKPFRVPELSRRGGAFSNEVPKLRFWGLLHKIPSKRDDGGPAGWYSVTSRGQEFVFGRLLIPKIALVYDDRLLGFSGEQVSIHEALREKFNYSELMNGVPIPLAPPPSDMNPPIQQRLF